MVRSGRKSHPKTDLQNQKLLKSQRLTWLPPEEKEGSINLLHCAINQPFSCHCLAGVCRLHGLWRSAPARATRPRKSQKVHATAESCGGALCLEWSKPTIKKCNCSSVLMRMGVLNEQMPSYTNLITISKLAFFVNHPFDRAKRKTTFEWMGRQSPLIHIQESNC